MVGLRSLPAGLHKPTSEAVMDNFVYHFFPVAGTGQPDDDDSYGFIAQKAD